MSKKNGAGNGSTCHNCGKELTGGGYGAFDGDKPVAYCTPKCRRAFNRKKQQEQNQEA